MMGLHTVMFIGTAPAGSLLLGALAERAGAPTAALVSGTVTLGAAVWLRRRLRRLRAPAAVEATPQQGPSSWLPRPARTDRSVLAESIVPPNGARRRQATADPERRDHRVRGARLPSRPGERGGVARRGGEGHRVSVLPHQRRPAPGGPR